MRILSFHNTADQRECLACERDGLRGRYRIAFVGLFVAELPKPAILAAAAEPTSGSAAITRSAVGPS